MIASDNFSGKRYAVYGLARTGKSVIAALRASGADVVAWDDDARARLGVAVPLIDLNTAELAGYDALIVSPGVPLRTHPLARRAAAAAVPIIGDIELFARARASLPPHKVIGVTGTNGKSTTTALIHHIISSAGIPSRMGGNIGLPILSQAPLLPNDQGVGVYVLELSSFQIDLTQSLDCDVAVLLNITPDHLDRHGDMASYADAKAHLFAMQSPQHIAVIATEDDFTRRIAARCPARLVEVTGTVNTDIQAGWPRLQGPHNAQNAAAATAACRAIGLSDTQIEAGLRSYPGLEHRMQIVRKVNGVLFVNDSKATNPTSTAPALAAYPHVHWIAGGIAKTAELDACLPHLHHVSAAYLIGEAAPVFAAILQGHVRVLQSGTLGAATRAAAASAVPGDVVLLSPACASFDQFSDFEARGRAFIEIVESL
ncbi:MAG: UDP-N-acetylmuramoyl-L-alanine--D-glutamate ligase [Polymorphobacter sp.]